MANNYMTVDELLAFHAMLCEQGRQIMKAKNADYSGGSPDPFANFRGSVNYGVHPEMGIAIRIGDKFKRVEAFINNGALAVQNESVIDSLVDVINYTILMAGMVQERINAQTKSELLMEISADTSQAQAAINEIREQLPTANLEFRGPRKIDAEDRDIIPVTNSTPNFHVEEDDAGDDEEEDTVEGLVPANKTHNIRPKIKKHKTK
jgi:hypothetical protein